MITTGESMKHINELSYQNPDDDGTIEIAGYIKSQFRPLDIASPLIDMEAPKSLAEKLDFLREQKLGRLTLIEAPNFWKAIYPKIMGGSHRPLLHLDYTASAQGLKFLESYLVDCLKTYANTHTETSETGKQSTRRFHAALQILKKHVHAPQGSFVLAAGYGATGAIERIQKILGLYMSPKGQKLIREELNIDLKQEMMKKYVVFVGPSEHHSNDVSWQDDALCRFVRIKAIPSGPQINEVDLEDLEKQLQAFPDHVKIASFSAASNVTGMKSDLKRIGELLKRYDSFFLVDYAAAGPYEDINMERDGIDAIFLSTHKNLGGSNLGLLIARDRLYDLAANPSFGGGGTVSAVTPWEYRFHPEIEEREFPGTPAIRQVWQAALSFQIKDWIGVENIAQVDQKLCETMLNFFSENDRLIVLGNLNPKKRHPIFSFLVKHGDQYLHHTFVASLLNDFFGIQARSGCACAGPFGHELLKIQKDLSDKYLVVIQHVLNGFKPGWTRIGTHYTMSEEELEYLKIALNAVSWFGALFLDQYTFDPYSGDWHHDESVSEGSLSFGLSEAIRIGVGQGHRFPELTGEDQLYQSFKNQIEEFILLTSFKVVSLLTKEAQVQLPSADFEKLALRLTDEIRRQITGKGVDERSFSQQVADLVCPMINAIKKPQQSADCEKEVVDRISSILFRPQNRPDLYESFDGLLKDVRFFYVWKDKLQPTIDPVTVNAINSDRSLAIGHGDCKPCVKSI